MSPLAIGLCSFPALIGMIFLRVPVGLAMLVCGLVGSAAVLGTIQPAWSQWKFLAYDLFSSHSLSIIPMFLLMGQFATRGGMSSSLFAAAEAFLRHRRGGVAQAAIAACGGFGAICGSSLATAATMGQVALPELRKYGYSNRLATAALAAGGTLGVLIPPSVVLVVYAILTEQNIAKLFAAAFLPAMIALAGYLAVVSAWMRMDPEKETRRAPASAAERWSALCDVWPAAAIFASVLGGIYWGVFTPTEGAAVGCIGAGLTAAFRGKMGWDGFRQAALAAAASSAMIFFVLFGATVFNSFLAYSRLPQAVAEFVVGWDANPWLILTAILLCYLLFGCVMDSLSMIFLTIPIFFPIVSALDFGLPPEEAAIWFGILVLVVVEVGLITPPVGLNLFIINRLAEDTPISETFRGVLPFIASDILRVAALAAFPVLSLWLPRMLF